MDVGQPHIAAGYRPGAVSTFFVYKAGLFALCFWGWLGYLAITADTVTGWHIVAATGAVTTTLVGLILGVRMALAHNAADRHEQLMRTLVEISWYSFAQSPPPVDSDEASPGPSDGDASVFRLLPEGRQRPRR